MSNKSLDPVLLQILVCPVCKGDLGLKDDELICVRCKRRYPIIDGIPHLLSESAR